MAEALNATAELEAKAVHFDIDEEERDEIFSKYR